MPQLLERLVSQLKAKGMGEQQAYAIAMSTLQRAGDLDHHGDLTSKGKRRQGMGAAGRAKDRAAHGTKHKASDYSYSSKTNRATLRGA